MLLLTALELMERISQAHTRALALLRKASDLRSTGYASQTGGAGPAAPQGPPPQRPAAEDDTDPQDTGPQDTDDVTVRLSRQEQRVLRLVSHGMSNRSIARELRLSEQTIKNYLSSAFRKLGVNSRTEAAFYMLRAQSDLPTAPEQASP
ncbi:response regulator transcription factor [Streptomyces gobitricini]|uniref:response regulator transcription factor n=1 Tax=Streptomyces gobitricini TaxID=68211 RepID=UPI0031D16730